MFDFSNSSAYIFFLKRFFMVQRRILGLDISTTCIGCCIMDVDENGNNSIFHLTYVKPKIKKGTKGMKSLFLKNKYFMENFMEEWKDAGITDVVIEEPLISSNNSKTAATLLRFNGIISNSIFDLIGVVPEYISSYEARKLSFPELFSIRNISTKGKIYPLKQLIKALENNTLALFADYPKDINKKEVMMGKVNTLFPNIEWKYNKKKKFVNENYDISDSIVVILGFLNREKYGEEAMSVISYKINEKKKKIDYIMKLGDSEFKKTLKLS